MPLPPLARAISEPKIRPETRQHCVLKPICSPRRHRRNAWRCQHAQQPQRLPATPLAASFEARLRTFCCCREPQQIVEHGHAWPRSACRTLVCRPACTVNSRRALLASCARSACPELKDTLVARIACVGGQLACGHDGGGVDGRAMTPLSHGVRVRFTGDPNFGRA